MNTTSSVKLATLGGFLGSGKTTLMIELGKKLVSEMNTVVAIVTNDQGEVLVDTKMVKDFGFACAEVLHGCFCCRFPDFISSIHELLATINPEIILAEPVGSCTDLLATVYAPLHQYYGNKLSLAPYTILVDASTILNYDKKFNIISPKASEGYLLSWQIQEAEVIGINKVDLVSSKQLVKVENLLKGINREAELIHFSAKTGYNLDRLVELFLARNHSPRPSIEVDYKIYGAAEAELGWFNGSWRIVSDQPLKLDDLVKDIMVETTKRIDDKGGMVVHLKLTFSTEEGSAKASLVLSEKYMDITGEIPPPSNTIDVIMNIRAKLDPEGITECVQNTLKYISFKFNVRYTNWLASSFRPAFPKPYYRLLHT